MLSLQSGEKKSKVPLVNVNQTHFVFFQKENFISGGKGIRNQILLLSELLSVLKFKATQQ